MTTKTAEVKSTTTTSPNKTRVQRRTTPYAMFQKDTTLRNQLKQQLQEENGSTPNFGQVAKAMAEKWKSLSPSERSKYTQLSDACKTESTSHSAPKDKRARTAYAFFSMDPAVKQAIKNEKAGSDLSNMSKLISEKWKTLSADERKPYELQSQQEKASLAPSSNSSSSSSSTEIVSTETKTSKASGGKVRKRARSAYTFYSSDTAVRQAVKDANPDADFGSLSKLISAQWKSLSAEERAPYDEKSAEEKKQFQEQSSSSSSPEKTKVRIRARSAYTLFTMDPEVKEAIRKENPELKFSEYSKIFSVKWGKLKDRSKYENAHQEEVLLVAQNKANLPEGTKGKTKPKQRRAKSAYTLYSSNPDVRQKLKESHPSATFGEISKLISQQWKELSAKERKPYLDQSNQEKAEMAAEKQASVKPKTRAKSAYLHYSMSPEVREKAKNENPNKSVTELAKILGTQWKALSDEEKKPYHQLYLDEKASIQATKTESANAEESKE